MNDIYFAMQTGEELAAAVYTKVEQYNEAIVNNGRFDLWRKAYRAYNALSEQDVHQASRIRKGGEQNELHLLKANHYRNLISHLHVLVTQQRPSFECRAINTDYKSQLQAILGVNILEYYLREKRLEPQYRLAAEYCLNYGEAYLLHEWDEFAGENAAADIENDSFVKTGDVRSFVFDPRQVARQCRSDTDGQMNWYVITRWGNRHDLAAEHPEFAEEIMGVADSSEFDEIFNSTKYFSEDDDLIPYHIFYHDRTPACPKGRYAKVIGNRITLKESTLDDLRYKRLPVYRMAAYDQHGTSFGYTVGFDLLCVQEAIDVLYSTILSNQMAFGVQNIWMKPGSTLYPSQLAGGLNVLESEEKPESINLTYTPPEIFKFLQSLEQLGEVLSGVNSVARGQPEASLKSGSALALVASQAVQFSNSIQASYMKLLEDSGTGIIEMLQTRATEPRTTVILGKNNRSYMKEFTGDDIKSINRVLVEVGNPVGRTVAGRIQMAQDMLQAQVIKRPEQYLQVVTTGKLEPMIEDEQAEMLLIRSENEDLRDGKAIVVTAVDQHPQHIQGHKSVLADPEARRQPELVAAVLAHIQEHIDQLSSVRPELLNLLGMAPLQAGAPPQGANAPQSMPNQQPQAEQSQTEQAPAPTNAPEMQPLMPNMPSVPNTEPSI